ncbi:hypothetical protein [Nonomuraea gerenzanensis]|uniref:hypothetical protein n=1 Tax=Nonomuraea gerenzanensis TaxID=93944 RepID=UPI001CD9438D|nr:hypothetical protein [Nonomuraea gerenzanensis]UBU10977.1 hypothetical protein LCN96_42705 [Nonomuraea gerenzanensis]
MTLTRASTVVILAALATGCQLAGPAPAAEQAPSRSEPVVRASTAAPSLSAATVPPDKVLAAREGTIEGHTFNVEIVQLLRRERFVNLTFTATVTKEGGGLGWQVHNAFAAVPSQSPTVDGVFLVDVRNAKKHLVALDSEGKCVCSRIESLFLKQDQKAVFSATFAAPPADVGSVDVHIPNVGTLANVPIS